MGTGALFAADMRRKAKGRWIEAALASMRRSNRAAAACLRDHGVTAMTDVTGFGLLGHLLEMVNASTVDIMLDLDCVPLLPGALDVMQHGIFSSLQPQNVRLRRAIRNHETANAHPRYAALFDPQTAGGLLAGVPAERASACVQHLRTLGYADAAAVGQVTSCRNASEPVSIQT